MSVNAAEPDLLGAWAAGRSPARLPRDLELGAWGQGRKTALGSWGPPDILAPGTREPPSLLWGCRVPTEKQREAATVTAVSQCTRPGSDRRLVLSVQVHLVITWPGGATPGPGKSFQLADPRFPVHQKGIWNPHVHGTPEAFFTSMSGGSLDRQTLVSVSQHRGFRRVDPHFPLAQFPSGWHQNLPTERDESTEVPQSRQK